MLPASLGNTKLKWSVGVVVTVGIFADNVRPVVPGGRDVARDAGRVLVMLSEDNVSKSNSSGIEVVIVVSIEVRPSSDVFARVVTEIGISEVDSDVVVGVVLEILVPAPRLAVGRVVRLAAVTILVVVVTLQKSSSSPFGQSGDPAILYHFQV